MTVYNEASARISECGHYRYRLARAWTPSPRRRVLFVMLNPSTADGAIDDPTIRRCVGFARSWGYDALEVVNLFAFRATDPAELGNVDDPVGDLNDAHIIIAAGLSDLVVCAWGAHTAAAARAAHVLGLLRSIGQHPHALARTMNGSPAHPLYLRKGLLPMPYDGGRP